MRSRSRIRTRQEGEPIGTEGRVRLAEKLFLAAIVKDVIARRGDERPW